MSILTGCSSGGSSDRIPPAISLLGENPLTINFGEEYVEPGATANDNEDGSVTVTITGAEAIGSVGEHIVTYSAQDASGNTATASRTVVVQDVVPPTIALIDTSPFLVYQGEAFVDPGVEVVDDADDSPSTSITGTVDTSKLGSYLLAYDATDASGNSAQIEREVAVVGRVTEGSAPARFFPTDGGLFFVADDGIAGREPWRLDNNGSISQIADLRPGDENANFDWVSNIEGFLILKVRNEDGSVSINQYFDTQKTELLAFAPGQNSFEKVGELNGKLLYTTDARFEFDLHALNPRTQSSELLIDSARLDGDVFVTESTAYFLDEGVWSTDASSQGTAKILEIDTDNSRILGVIDDDLIVTLRHQLIRVDLKSRNFSTILDLQDGEVVWSSLVEGGGYLLTLFDQRYRALYVSQTGEQTELNLDGFGIPSVSRGVLTGNRLFYVISSEGTNIAFSESLLTGERLQVARYGGAICGSSMALQPGPSQTERIALFSSGGGPKCGPFSASWLLLDMESGVRGNGTFLGSATQIATQERVYVLSTLDTGQAELSFYDVQSGEKTVIAIGSEVARGSFAEHNGSIYLSFSEKSTGVELWRVEGNDVSFVQDINQELVFPVVP